MREVWKPIPGFDGYEVSNCGRVRSYKRRWKSGVPRIMSTRRLVKGYPVIRLCVNGIKHQINIHRLVMLAFVGPPPDGMEVCHNNNNRADSRLDNLRYDTAIGNIRDRCRFTDEQIISIRERRARGEKMTVIAKEYGVSCTHIWNICTGRNKSLASIGGPITPSRPRTPYIHIRHNYTDAQITDMRQRRQDGELLQSIADDYNTSIGNISKICLGLGYKNVPMPTGEQE